MDINWLIRNWWMLPLALVIVVLVYKFFPRYRIAPPDTAFIISGLYQKKISGQKSGWNDFHQKIRLSHCSRRRDFLYPCH